MYLLLQNVYSLIIGIRIPKGAIKDEQRNSFETIRFVISTFPVDFQFIMQPGIDNPKVSYSEWGFPLKGLNGMESVDFSTNTCTGARICNQYEELTFNEQVHMTDVVMKIKPN